MKLWLVFEYVTGRKTFLKNATLIFVHVNTIIIFDFMKQKLHIFFTIINDINFIIENKFTLFMIWDIITEKKSWLVSLTQCQFDIARLGIRIWLKHVMPTQQCHYYMINLCQNYLVCNLIVPIFHYLNLSGNKTKLKINTKYLLQIFLWKYSCPQFNDFNIHL